MVGMLMLYVKIAYTKTNYGSTSECPVLNAYIKRARWQYVDPDDVTIGYAGLEDTDYGILQSPCVQEASKDEAIEFKSRVEFVFAKMQIKAMATDTMTMKIMKLKYFEDVKSGFIQPDADDLQEWIDDNLEAWGLS